MVYSKKGEDGVMSLEFLKKIQHSFANTETRKSIINARIPISVTPRSPKIECQIRP